VNAVARKTAVRYGVEAVDRSGILSV